MHVSHLESAIDGTRFEKDEVHTLHKDRPLWVRYHLDQIRMAVYPDELLVRSLSMWRYRELLPLPVHSEPVTLGEGMTPLIPCTRLGKELGLAHLWIKDEGQMPTGSFKSRGLSMAVSMAKHFGLKRLAIPTQGNAGGALAAYGARAGMEVFVFMPRDTPRINQVEAYLCGAKVFLVDGFITDCGKIVRAGKDDAGWFDMSTLKEPYRIEGKKTMGLELAEQMHWKLPHVVLYPTGGGTGLIGMWKAFHELQQIGWLKSTHMPRMVSCQSDGCPLLIPAFEAQARFAKPVANPHTKASGLRVPAAIGDFMMLDAIRESGGLAIAGREERIDHWMRRVASLEGVCICPETAICFDCLEQMVERKKVQPDEQIIVFNTGAGQKYPECVEFDLPTIDKDQPVDYKKLVGSGL